jgi:hypothetical protein
VGGVLAISLSATSAHGAPPAPSVETLIETERTILDQPIFYPSGTSKITAQIITLPSHASTALHLHAVPMFAYILKGELVVDYGSAGERRYRAARSPRLVDGADEVHKVTVARRILKGYAPVEVPTEHRPTRRKHAQQKFAEYLDTMAVNA